MEKPKHKPAKEEAVQEKTDQKLAPEVKPETELETLKRQNAELRELTQRLQAEFENYKKRTQKEQVEAAIRTKAQLLRTFLPLLDTFDAALLGNPNDKGLAALHKQCMSTFHEAGVQPLQCVGKPFDYTKHEVIMMQPHKGAENIVLAQVQKGYTFSDLILRYAKVIISKKEDENTDNNAQDTAKKNP